MLKKLFQSVILLSALLWASPSTDVSAWTRGTNAITAPSQAAAAGFNTLKTGSTTFNTLSTIDMASTRVAGFNWYPFFDWPDVSLYGDSGWTNSWGSFPAQDTSRIHLDATGVRSDFGITNGLSLASAAYSASAPGNVIGNTFGGGGYFEVRFQPDIQPTFSWPVGAAYYWFMMPVEWFLHQLPNATYFPEIDVMESSGYNGTAGAPSFWQPILIHTTNCSPDTPSCEGPSTNAINKNWPASITAFHTLGFLWITMAQGGGTGTFAWYLDNVLQNTVTYTSGDPVATIENLHFVIFLGNLGVGQYQSVFEFVRVWGPP